jgi:hypothetical protein
MVAVGGFLCPEVGCQKRTKSLIEGGFMKVALLLTVLMLFIGVSTTSVAQVLEFAAKCDEAQKQLAEWVKKPDSTDAQRIKEAIGLDILISCATTTGQIICFECIDKDQNFRTLQLLQKRDTKQLELLGFGCRCKDQK